MPQTFDATKVEKLFVDYCGPTMNIFDENTGECLTAQVFFAVMGHQIKHMLKRLKARNSKIV